MSELTWRAIEYVMYPGEPGAAESGMWGITLAWRGPDQWGVYRGCYMHPHHFGFDADGHMEMEPARDDRDDEWKATHRFPLAEAMALGERVLPTIKINGMRWEQVVAWRAGGHQRDDKGRPIIPVASSAPAPSPLEQT